MKFIEAIDAEYPRCPHCHASIEEVKFKDIIPLIWGVKKLIVFCPHCQKVIGVSSLDCLEKEVSASL